MSTHLDLTVAEAAAAIGSGAIDAAEYGADWSDMARTDGLNAYLWIAGRDGSGAEPGVEPVGAARPPRPLEGIPVAIKDLFCTEGIPTSAGSRMLERYIPPYTATAVANLLEAGARIIGKTNLDEFAMGSSNEHSAFGPVLNPWDRTRAPGGSSGGSAAAVAAGLAPAAIGTDTGGSIRQPASLCGVVGLKPTYGAISRLGMVAFASSLDQAGPLTRTVDDAALLLDAMQGRDGADATSVGLGKEPVVAAGREDLSGLSLGIPAGILDRGVERGVAESFKQAIAVAEACGAETREVALPHIEHGLSAYYVIGPAEASANLARYDGVRFGFRAEAGDLDGMYEATRSEGFGPEVKRRIMLGTFTLSSGYYDAYYGRAQRVRTKIAGDFRSAFESCDLVLTPTSPSVAFKLGIERDDPWAMYVNDLFTAPVSLAGLPAISIPCGLAEPDGGGPGLPVGLQMIGPAFGERELLGAARVLEHRFEFDRNHGHVPVRGGVDNE